MPKNGSKSKCNMSDSESSSDNTTDSVKMYMIQQKSHKHKKNHKKHHTESETDSESHSESHKKSDKKHEKENKCDKKHDKYDKKNEHHTESSSEDSKCSNKEKCTFDDVYKYYKNQLLLDETLQVGGSDTYISSYNNTGDTYNLSYPINFTNNNMLLNVDHPSFNAPFCVRSSGIYLLFFVTSVQQSSQFTLFINGIPNTISTTGNNAGSGQTIFRQMYKFNKDDTLIMRNYESSAGSLISPLYVGGLLPGNNATFLLMKLGSLHCDEHKKLCNDWNPSCLSRRKQYLFKKILEKMLLDPELMLKGYNTCGTFWTKATQILPTENDVIFDSSSNVNNIGWSSTTPEQIKILEDGIYKVFFMCNTTTSVQLTFYVNGMPMDFTTMGSNKGAGQTSLRTLLSLKKGDYVTVRNHTSTNGQVIINDHDGGILDSLNAILTIFKIAPLYKCVIKNDCKINSYYKKSFDKFKSYLLSNKHLQLTGTDVYFNYASTNSQVLHVGDAINWELTTLKENVQHRQATVQTVIEKDGIYDLFIDCITSEPAQFTIFINGIPDLDTTTGRDSGANKCLIRQFVKLYKGDVIDVRNYTSTSVNVTTSLNSGGSIPGIPVFFMGFKLCNLDETCNKKLKNKN